LAAAAAENEKARVKALMRDSACVTELASASAAMKSDMWKRSSPLARSASANSASTTSGDENDTAATVMGDGIERTSSRTTSAARCATAPPRPEPQSTRWRVAPTADTSDGADATLLLLLLLLPLSNVVGATAGCAACCWPAALGV